jgi:hypothetical protein
MLLVHSAAIAQAPKSGPGCNLPNADTVIHGIGLADEQSAIRVLGRGYETVIADPGTDLAWVIFASRDSKQLLALRHHPGYADQSFMEAEVKFGRHDRKPLKLPVYEFVSGRGIKLGMTRRNVVRALGPCFSSTLRGRSEMLRYELLDQSAALLRAVRSLKYYAEYEFESGRLVRFRFGHNPA